ncbi:hypothetical protein IG631_04861 [Alternaria alternata]|nr:hypothetical protein IG631_04861 [Alternaria alternata]
MWMGSLNLPMFPPPHISRIVSEPHLQGHQGHTDPGTCGQSQEIPHKISLFRSGTAEDIS